MRRAFVGGRGLVTSVSGLGQLSFRAGQPVGQLGNLPGKLQDHPILLLHVALKESKPFFEIAEPRVHEEERNQVRP
jgi:hypothetical protein